MRFYLDARALQKSDWQGEQLYVYNLIRAMALAGDEHHFHLHFGWNGWDQRLTDLTQMPNISAHHCTGKYWSHASVPWKILATRSRVYFRMYNEIRPMHVPVTCPVVILVHDLRGFKDNFYGPNIPASESPANHQHVHRFEHIVTVSKTIRDEIIHHFGIPPERITVALNGFDSSFNSGPQHKPDSLPLNCPFFLMVNPGGGHKNWQDVVNAFVLFCRRNPDKHYLLILAGNLHHEKEAIETFRRSHAELGQRILPLGYVSDPELRYLYAHARTLIYPSRYEGFGRPILEAMLFGTPVIASDIPIFREVAGNAALFSPLDRPDGMASIIEKIEFDADLRHALAAKGRAQPQQYLWSPAALAVLATLINLGQKKTVGRRMAAKPSEKLNV